MLGHRSGKRPWLAAALALFYPGLGHAYLREWLRALAWFGLMFTTTALALPSSAVPEAGSGLSFEAVVDTSRALPTEASVLIVVLFALNTVDAYRLARQRSPRDDSDRSGDEDDRRCPHCGRETDGDYTFCQWCGEALDDGR